MRTILFVSGGIETVPGIRRAKEMGLHVVVSDGSPVAPGFNLADDRLIVSTYDVYGTVSAVKDYHRIKRPIDGAICVAADVPLTVAAVAEELGISGITIESARLAMDKLAMKDRFAHDGIPIPWYASVSTVDELSRFVSEHGYPLVIKPVDSRGARGVLRLIEGANLYDAFAFARGESPTGRVMIERFLPGPQISTESIVLDGVTYTPGFSDRNYEYLERYSPHIIENGGDLPSAVSQDQQQAVRDLVGAAAASMGIQNGVVKGDIVISKGRPHVIELAARLSGGYFCTHEIPLNTGVDFVGCAIRVALGEKPDPGDLVPDFIRPVCQRYLFPPPGRVTAVQGAEAVARRPGIELCEVRVRVGDVIGPVYSHPARAGVVIATGETREEARSRAEAAVRDIQIQTAVEPAIVENV